MTSSPAGINCGAVCSATFASGTSITLTATPAAGSLFGGWSGGGCTGTGVCRVTLNANTSVTASFNVPTTTAPPLVFNPPTVLPDATVGVEYLPGGRIFSFCRPTPATPTSACGPFPPTTDPTGGVPPYHFQLGPGVGFPPFGLSLSKDGPLPTSP